jgi:hypothetical protein
MRSRLRRMPLGHRCRWQRRRGLLSILPREQHRAPFPEPFLGRLRLWHSRPRERRPDPRPSLPCLLSQWPRQAHPRGRHPLRCRPSSTLLLRLPRRAPWPRQWRRPSRCLPGRLARRCLRCLRVWRLPRERLWERPHRELLNLGPLLAHRPRAPRDCLPWALSLQQPPRRPWCSPPRHPCQLCPERRSPRRLLRWGHVPQSWPLPCRPLARDPRCLRGRQPPGILRLQCRRA